MMRTFHLAPLVVLPALLAACDDSGTSEVGAFDSVDNQSDAKMIFDDGELVDEGEHGLVDSPNGVRIVCAASEEDALDAWVDDDQLIIEATGRGDPKMCDVHVYAPDVHHITVTGNGDLESDAVFTNLESVTVRGSGSVMLWGVHTDHTRFDVAGNGDVGIEDLRSADVDFDLSGNGVFTAAGVVDHAHLRLSGNGDFLASELIIGELDAAVSGNGTVEVNVTGTATISVSGSATVTVWGGADVFAVVTGSGSIEIF
jgi:hypothetical protein